MSANLWTEYSVIKKKKENKTSFPHIQEDTKMISYLIVTLLHVKQTIYCLYPSTYKGN